MNTNDRAIEKLLRENRGLRKTIADLKHELSIAVACLREYREQGQPGLFMTSYIDAFLEEHADISEEAHQ